MLVVGRASSQWLRPARASARVLSTLHMRVPVPLVYDLYEPPKPSTAAHTGSILFLHGLFGSKRNNRSISKYDYHTEMVLTHQLTTRHIRILARDLRKPVYALVGYCESAVPGTVAHHG